MLASHAAIDKPDFLKLRRMHRSPQTNSHRSFYSARSTGTSHPNVLGSCLSELGHEGNHEIEKTNSLDKSETQNSVREELATESRVAGNTVDKSGEDETDTNTGTSQTNGSGTHTQVLGDLNESLSELRGVGAALLESIALGGLEDRRSLLALEGLERAGSA